MDYPHNQQKTANNQTKAIAVKGKKPFDAHVKLRNITPEGREYFNDWDREHPEAAPWWKQKEWAESKAIRDLAIKINHGDENYSSATWKRAYRQYHWNTIQREQAIRAGYGKNTSTSEKAQKSRQTIAEVTEIMVRKLIQGSRGRINPYREEKGNISNLDTSSGEITYDDNRYQHWNMLPLVASADRKDMSAALALFLHVSEQRQTFEVADRDGEIHEIPATHPGEVLKFRYIVLTGGRRIPLSMIESRIIYIRATLRKAVKNLQNRNIPIHIVFQGVEVTLKRDNRETVWAHPHLNILYRFDRHLSKDEWNLFLEIMQKAFTDDAGNKLMWKECGILSNPDEVVKYVTKMQVTDDELSELESSVGEELAEEYEDEEHPTDYGHHIGLVDLTPEEMVEYFYQLGPRDATGRTKRRKIMLPQGDFQIVNSTFNDWGIRFRNVLNEDGTFKITPIAKERREPRNQEHTPGGNPRVENMILNESLCHPNATNERATTKLKVDNLTRHPKTPEGKRNLERIWGIFVERSEMAAANGYEYDAREAFENFMSQSLPPRVNKFKQAMRAINVHTKHVTMAKFGKASKVLLGYFSSLKQTQIHQDCKHHELSELIFIQGLTASPPPRIHEPHTSVFLQ